MSRAGFFLAALIVAAAALQIGAALRPHAAALPIAACGPCHDGTLMP
jgi:hypothetical protein